jgi:sporulation protein YlmC with PRC-barrel domain
MSADPVSWLVVEPGWKVVTADGKEVGRVDEIVGDTGKDIFSGLSVSQGLLRKPRHVASELVSEIVEGEVRLDVDSNAFERLDHYEQPPPSEEILPPEPQR